MSAVTTATIKSDFDRLAALDSDGWTANNHYHDFLLQHLPAKCENALEIGCGTGAFSRRLAERSEHVLALDLSTEMIRVARSRSSRFPNLRFEVADAVVYDLPAARFDCIATIATLHHLALRQMLFKLKEALKPGGVLIILDLFQPERGLLTVEGWRDWLAEMARLTTSVGLRLVHNGRLRPPREVRAAWAEHGKADHYLKMKEVSGVYGEILPDAVIRKHLLWRYSVVWRKQAA